MKRSIASLFPRLLVEFGQRLVRRTMFGLGFNAFTNWGTMLPAAAVTYGALLNDPYARQSIMVDRE